MTMQPFYMSIGLSSPIIMRGHLTLDGLLGGAVFEQRGDEMDIVKALDDLPLKKTCVDGSDRPLYHASALRMRWGSPMRDVSQVKSLNPNRLYDEDFARLRQGRRLPKINDKFPNKIASYIAIGAPAVWFFGVGDIGRIATIMRRVRFIGTRRHGGFGEISELSDGRSDVMLYPVSGVDEHTFGLLDEDGLPARPMPVSVWDSLSTAPQPIVFETWHNPYWDRTCATKCVVPSEAWKMFRRSEDPKYRVCR